MRPQTQTPSMGAFGDCHRTCIAMILDMDRDEVPHFMADVPMGLPSDDPRSQAAEQAERDWMAERGLAVVSIPINGEAELGNVIESVSLWARDTAVILGGVTAGGGCHSVVLYQGRVYDPKGPGLSLVGPQPTGWWFVTIYAHRTQPIASEHLPTETPDPNVVTTQED